MGDTRLNDARNIRKQSSFYLHYEQHTTAFFSFKIPVFCHQHMPVFHTIYEAMTTTNSDCIFFYGSHELTRLPSSTKMRFSTHAQQIKYCGCLSYYSALATSDEAVFSVCSLPPAHMHIIFLFFSAPFFFFHVQRHTGRLLETEWLCIAKRGELRGTLSSHSHLLAYHRVAIGCSLAATNARAPARCRPVRCFDSSSLVRLSFVHLFWRSIIGRAHLYMGFLQVLPMAGSI